MNERKYKKAIISASTLLMTLSTMAGCGTWNAMTSQQKWILVGSAAVTGYVVSKQGNDHVHTPHQECYAIVPPGSIEQHLC